MPKTLPITKASNAFVKDVQKVMRDVSEIRYNILRTKFCKINYCRFVNDVLHFLKNFAIHKESPDIISR